MSFYSAEELFAAAKGSFLFYEFPSVVRWYDAPRVRYARDGSDEVAPSDRRDRLRGSKTVSRMSASLAV